MVVHKILTEPDPVLRQKSLPVDVFDDALRTLISDMFETMYEANGIGLAAIQIGAPKRVIVMDIKENDISDPRVFINPEFVYQSDSNVPYREGCLSIPQIYNNVMRPDKVTVKYQDDKGEARTLEAEGLLAVCIQHECDHLEGVLFIDRLPVQLKQLAIKRLRKLQGARVR